MAAAKSEKHWGKWVSQRLHYVGWRNQRELAAAIGCSPERLSRWMGLEEPPRHMLKGFDQALVRLLKTDRLTLFTEFKSIKPDAATLIDTNAPISTKDATRRRVLAMVELMPDDGLKELACVGERLLRGGMLQVA